MGESVAAIASVPGRTSFLTWMTRIVINLSRSTAQKRSRLNRSSSWTIGGGTAMPVITRTDGAIERSELRQRIDRALGQLSYEHRTVLVLHEFQELEYKEIAKG
jgi:RNA polymerase sigma-70 factor (ECF subfamily)